MVINKANRKKVESAFPHLTKKDINELYAVINCKSTKAIRENNPERYQRATSWKNSCYNPPKLTDMKLSCLNDLLEGYGVESLGNTDSPGYYPEYAYINLGDTYTTTIVYKRETGKYLLSSWGDIAEKLTNNQED